ncbi:hypothetical protein ACMFMG_000655 [Clarireedia jacksonii]
METQRMPNAECQTANPMSAQMPSHNLLCCGLYTLELSNERISRRNIKSSTSPQLLVCKPVFPLNLAPVPCCSVLSAHCSLTSVPSPLQQTPPSSTNDKTPPSIQSIGR